MRVITGAARGRNLLSPEGLDTRPTSAMAKESMFSMIQFEVEGAEVLDLFAGSGQLGVEALSRGAKFAVFVDRSKDSRETILKNLELTGLSKQARVAAMDYMDYLRGTKEQFDIVFLDPPYGQGMIEKALPLLAGRVRPGGIILCETDRREDLPDAAGRFTRKKEYRYGKAKVTTYRQEVDEL